MDLDSIDQIIQRADLTPVAAQQFYDCAKSIYDRGKRVLDPGR
jgi:hypothetical protein